MALEPFVRRRWPERIISWTRVLARDFRDPMVGRDLLIGAIFGVGWMLWGSLRYQIPIWIGHPPAIPTGSNNVWLGAGTFLSFFGLLIRDSLQNGLVILFIVLMLSLILRRDKLAFAIGWAVLVLIVFLGSGGVSALDLFFVGIGVAIFGITPLWRYGLLAMVSLFFFFGLGSLPVTTNFTEWYATGFIIQMTVLMAVAVYGFYTSLDGQPLFGGKLFEE